MQIFAVLICSSLWIQRQIASWLLWEEETTSKSSKFRMDLWCTSSQVMFQWNTSLGNNEICKCGSCKHMTTKQCWSTWYFVFSSISFRLYWSHLHQRNKLDVLQSFSGEWHSHRHNHSDYRWGVEHRLSTLPWWLKVKNEIQFECAWEVVILHSSFAVFGMFLWYWWFVVICSSKCCLHWFQMETALCLLLQGLEAKLLCSKYLMEAYWSSHWVCQEKFPFWKTY